MLQTIGYDITQAVAEMVDCGLFVSLIQFMQADGTFGPSGQPSGTYIDVPGLVDLFSGASQIGCVDAPLSPGTISALEAKALAEIEAKGIRHVALNGYYPAVVDGWRNGWRAVIDGENYEVFGAETDSQTTQTRVKLWQVTL